MFLPVLRPFRVLLNTVVADGTFVLTLAPADGDAVFPFFAGQFVMLHLKNPDGTLWAKSAYSIASAPCESQTSIELAIKLQGDFTRRAEKLQVGDVVDLRGPYGVFTLRTDAERLVLLAGGVGITPLRSMLREALLTGMTFPIFLLYSEKTRAALAYENEFRDLAAKYSNFHPFFILTRDQPAHWDGAVTRLNANMLREFLQDFRIGRYCVCGPTEFMMSMKDLLVAEGVDTKTALQRESFG